MSVTGPKLVPSLFARHASGRAEGRRLPPAPAGALHRIPAAALRTAPPALPEVDEASLVRHFVNLSHLNWAVDTGFYPLGSCTMKFNPKVNEWAARLPGFASLHPLAPDETAQGTLELLWELERDLAEISGMDAVTLQPAAGAQGELTGILMIRAYHAARGDAARSEVLVPDSAHGTNPATASMAGFRTVNVPSAPDGGVDLERFRAALGPKTAAVMITNPSTLGLFEGRVVELLAMVHEAGALAYMDGANLNAILGRFRPGAAGFDVMHFNVHKTFSTPHGGGGPGAGPVGVRALLVPFLPGPRVLRAADGTFRLERPGERPASIGRVRAHVGNTGILVRAWAYIRAHGADGLREVSDDAVLAANYLKARLAADGTWEIPYPRACAHEFVASGAKLKRETGVRTLDVAKRLIDKGFHPPTIYFPLTVEEGMLIEPTETERLDTLDAFVDALVEIGREARDDPDLVREAPHTAPVRRLDEATAARQPNLRWRPGPGERAPGAG
jgi:glycine dehydrogenase subunit 2